MLWWPPGNINHRTMNTQSEFTLLSPSQAQLEIAKIFDACGQCELSVSEERAFKGKWLDLGTVTLVTSALEKTNIVDLLQVGAFEWQLPGAEDVDCEISQLLGIKPTANRYSAQNALDEIASIATRVGCIHPQFDPTDLEQMPFRRSTTVVVDTSGILHGALDFVVRFLHPAVRIKIPAITQMEIANQVDRFLSIRRARSKKEKPRISELLGHLKSQGGQRALLRVELDADTEVERTFLLGDPLRSAFEKDSSGDVKDLNISSPIRSYADRLILESARHHQAQSGSAHVVRLLTADQGLARMALAEGIRPIFFSSTKAADVFGQRLPGQTFNPFSGRICSTSLTTLIWELATCFGSARLVHGQDCFQVSAIGEQLPWFPYHADEDLLWCNYRRFAQNSNSTDKSKAPSKTPAVKEESTSKKSTELSPVRRTTAFFRFNVGSLFRLVCALDDLVDISDPQVEEILDRKSYEYRRFLRSGNFIEPVKSNWKASDRIPFFSAALRNERINEVKQALLHAPSFSSLASRLDRLEVGEPLDREHFGRGFTTYRVLGEVTLLCATISRNKIYTTPNVPSPEEFASIALDRFSSLVRDNTGLVATGEWLESLIQNEGIHPEAARRLLDEASTAGLLRRTTEGSTVQLRFQDRVVHVLRTESGLPVVEKVFLYRGDYLIPGKGSVSLRIENATT